MPTLIANYRKREKATVPKFIPLSMPDSKDWTIAQAKRVWRINAATATYVADHPSIPDYHTQEGQDYFFAICWWFTSRPLIDEDNPTEAERKRRLEALDAYVASLKG